MSLGGRVKEARITAGLSQRELAEKLPTKVRQSSISQIERGDTVTPKGSTILEIAEVTDYSADWLMTGKGPKKRVSGLTPEAYEVAAKWQRLKPDMRKRYAQALDDLLSADDILFNTEQVTHIPLRETERLRSLADRQTVFVIPPKTSKPRKPPKKP